MKYKYLNLLLCFIANSCLVFNPINSLYAENVNESPQYLETTVPNPQGIVIVAHGLNIKPSKMGTPSKEGTLIKLLLDSGYHVYRVTLKGHSGPLEDMQNVTWSDWIYDAYSQYCYARAIAVSERLPLYLLGFSLGALVYEVLMNEETMIPVQFEKTILFSPAVAIKPAAKIILWLQPFTNDRSIIRSVSPKEYRAQPGASMAAYKIVFAMEEALCASSFRNCNIDTIIFIDKNDEMVSTGILRERINYYGLTNWRIYEVTNAGAIIRPQYHHLLVDNKCVSALTWQYISEKILEFLN
ncbi:MAG: lysophospholipase [Bacteroidales bacterium]|jgi:esterase/lipase|nr:lysophospholipase [Bacteroidales bacterium]